MSGVVENHAVPSILPGYYDFDIPVSVMTYSVAYDLKYDQVMNNISTN